MAVILPIAGLLPRQQLPIFRRYALPFDANLESENSGHKFSELAGFAYF